MKASKDLIALSLSFWTKTSQLSQQTDRKHNEATMFKAFNLGMTATATLGD